MFLNKHITGQPLLGTDRSRDGWSRMHILTQHWPGWSMSLPTPKLSGMHDVSLQATPMRSTTRDAFHFLVHLQPRPQGPLAPAFFLRASVAADASCC